MADQYDEFKRMLNKLSKRLELDYPIDKVTPESPLTLDMPIATKVRTNLSYYNSTQAPQIVWFSRKLYYILYRIKWIKIAAIGIQTKCV